MTDLAKLVVRLEAQNAQYIATLEQSSRQAKKFHDDTTSALDGIANAFKGLVAAFAVGELFKQVIEKTSDASLAFGKLQNAVESNGGAVGKTAPQLEEFANHLQGVSTYSNDAIEGMQTLLLSFRAIGGPEFERAQQAILDISARMGTDLTSAARAVGKALQDPEQGMQALRRIGITFSADQQKVIRDLEDTGQKAKAQDVILSALETTFGGAAKAARDTFGGAIAGLKNAFADLLKVKGGLPEATAAINTLSDTLGSEEFKSAADTLFNGLIHGATEFATILVDATKETGPLGDTFHGLSIGVQGALDLIIALGKKAEEVAGPALSLAGKLIEKAGEAASGLAILLTGHGGNAVLDTMNDIEKEQKIIQNLGERMVQQAGAGVISKFFFGDPAKLAQQKQDAEKALNDLQAKLLKLQAPKPTDQVGKAGGVGIDDGSTKDIEEAQKQLDKLAETLGQQLSAGFNKSHLAAEQFNLSQGEMADNLRITGERGQETKRKILDFAAALDKLEAKGKLEDIAQGLEEQNAAFGKSDEEALKYSLTLGKLSVFVKRMADEGPALTKRLLDDAALKAHNDRITEIKTGLLGVQEQIAAFGGDTVQSALDKFDKQNEKLIQNLNKEGDTGGLQRVQNLRSLIEVQAEFNDLEIKEGRIRSDLSIQEQAIQNKFKTGQITELQALQLTDAATAQAADSLSKVNDQAQDLANGPLGKQSPQIVQAAKQMASGVDSVRASMNSLGKSIEDNIEGDFTTLFAGVLDGTKSLSDAFKSLVQDIEKEFINLIAKNFAQKLFSGLDGGTSGGGIFATLGSFFAGGRATGGDVEAGKIYKINENTPNSEYFIPGMSGTVVPKVTMGGGTTVNHFSFTVPGGQTASRQTQQQVMSSAARGLSLANRRNN